MPKTIRRPTFGRRFTLRHRREPLQFFRHRAPAAPARSTRLARSGADMEQVETVKVPGSWEIPLVAAELARQKRHDAIICLSAVVRGDTPHFDYVAGQAAAGIAKVSAESGMPVAFGVLTTNTFEQAIDRAGGKSGNKGFDAAMTAIEMADLMRTLRQGA